MKNTVSNDVAKEFIILLAYCEKSFVDMIPDDVLKGLNDLAADSNKEFYFDKTKSLLEQNLTDECKDLISEMYFTYVLDASSQKEILNEILNCVDEL